MAIHYAPSPNATDPAVRAQTVPDAADQGVMNYLRAHGFGATSQTVPSAADQGVMDYLRAHGVGQPVQAQPVLDTAPDEQAYPRLHPGRHAAPYAIPRGVSNYQLFVATSANSDAAPPLCARRRGAGCDGQRVLALPKD